MAGTLCSIFGFYLVVRRKYVSAPLLEHEITLRKLTLQAILAGLGILCISACGRASEQRLKGQHAYAVYCADCHDAAQGIGPRLSADVLASRGTAAHLFAYTRETMPYNAGALLTNTQYWDITAFLLARESLIDSGMVLSRHNAKHLNLLLP